MAANEPKTDFELIGRSLPDPVFILGTDGTVLSTSEGWLAEFGFKKHDIVGKNVFELDFLLTQKSKDIIRARLASRQEGKNTAPYELSLYTTSGEERFFLGEGRSSRFKKETVDIIHLVDITEHKRAQQKLKEAYETMVMSLALALEARDPYTKGHSERVKRHCRTIAREMNMPTKKIKELERAASLHDIGKIAVPDNILSKPARLTPPEFAQIQLHPEESVNLVRMIPNPRDTLLAIRHHHERPDGKGYPDGMSGDTIPLAARILAVADAYDALTSERPYRKAYSHEEAIDILRDGAGTQWDPEVVAATIKAITIKAMR